jgi:hypothetical protein
MVTGFTLGFWRGNIKSMSLRGDALSPKQSPTMREIASGEEHTCPGGRRQGERLRNDMKQEKK